MGKNDGKVYTVILRDEEPNERREDGREKAGVNWEVEIQSEVDEVGGGRKIWIPWEDFKPTYRGKKKEDTGKLKTGEVRRVGLMMRR